MQTPRPHATPPPKKSKLKNKPTVDSAVKPEVNDDTSTRAKLILIAAILMVSINLRPTLLSLGPVLDSVRLSLDLSSSAAGFLVTLPVLCFGLFAPFTPRLLRFQSAERLILIGLTSLAAGIVLRSLFGATGMFSGTLISGASISIVMVLIPSLIKRHFSNQAGMMMGLYSTALCLGAALAAAATVPIENIPGSDWRWALAFWVVPVLIAIIVWQPHTQSNASIKNQARHHIPKLRSSWLAWQVTLYMGFQSSIAYCVFGWLPIIMIDRGLSPLMAGFVLSTAMVMQLITSLLAPWLATRGRDQRSTIVGMLALTSLGLIGLFYRPLNEMWLWSTLLGLGLGGTFSLALALLVLRSPNAHVAASLSGMTQGIGYTVAAAGPFIVGLLRDATGNWHGVAIFFAFLILTSLCFGLGAGRSRYITVDQAT